MSLHSYIKIFPASGRFQEFFVGKEVEITEKIDGSQIAFGKDASGKLYMRSKGAPLNPEEGNVQKLFLPAVERILSVAHLIPNDAAYYGETLATPRHNTLKYDRVPEGHIALYGVTDFGRTKNLAQDYDELTYFADVLGFGIVPLLYVGTLHALEQLKTFLGKPSALGGANLEGVVVKNYNQNFMVAGSDYYPLVAMKYVSEEFKEAHAGNAEYIPRTSNIETLLAAYRTEARWKKAIQRFREDGLLTDSPKDIGPLIKYIEKDIEDEEKEDFKERLYSIYRKDLMRTATKDFPQWYKDQLLTLGVPPTPPDCAA